MKWTTRLLVLAALAGGLVCFHVIRSNRPLRVDIATRENTALLGNATELSTLDPHVATGQPEHMVFAALFEGLVAPDVANPDKPAPGAAASWETKDSITWLFHLRPDGKWSDGHPLTAHDFVWSYQRLLTPELAGQYASMLFPLKNAEEFNKGTLKDFSQVGVKALDDYTLQLQLVGPMPYLLGMLKHYSWFPVPRHVIEKFGNSTDRANRWTKAGNLVGNGPFYMKEWRFTHSLTVLKNLNYWDAKTVRLDKMVFIPIASDTTEERAFRDGQIHSTFTLPNPLIQQYMAHHQDVLTAEPILSVYFYRINTTREGFKDKRVRQALSMAIDRDGIINNILRAGQKPALGLTPYPESLDYLQAPKVIKFDPVEARRLLAEAGYPDGLGFPKFDILINTHEAHRVIAEAVQEMWRKNLGIQVGIYNQDWGVYLESQRQMNYSVCRAAWGADYPDPLTFLAMWKTGDGNNETGWSNARYDELLVKSSQEGDATKRLDLLGQAESILLEDMPIIPFYWYVHVYAARPELKGRVPSVLQHRAYKGWYLDPSVIGQPTSMSNP